MQTDKALDCSIIVLAWQDSEMTIRSMESFGRNVEIILVDNGSDEPHASALREACDAPNRVYVRCDRNLGYAGGMNAGLLHATRSVVIFSNNDVFASEDSIRRLCEVAVAPRVGAAFPYTRDDEGNSFLAAGHFITLGRSLGRAIGLNFLPGSRFDLECKATDADWYTGPFVAMSRLLALSLGGIPTQSFFYAEDYRLCWRLHQANLESVVVPNAYVTHLEDTTSKKMWDEADRAKRQTYQLLHAAMDGQPSWIRKQLLGVSFIFGSWWRYRLGSNAKRAAILAGAMSGYREYGRVHVT
jgi:N-acetylglucosaminyl-diphospho-decaprenol L-rhamnosyltransferase